MYDLRIDTFVGVCKEAKGAHIHPRHSAQRNYKSCPAYQEHDLPTIGAEQVVPQLPPFRGSQMHQP